MGRRIVLVHSGRKQSFPWLVRPRVTTRALSLEPCLAPPVHTGYALPGSRRHTLRVVVPPPLAVGWLLYINLRERERKMVKGNYRKKKSRSKQGAGFESLLLFTGGVLRRAITLHRSATLDCVQLDFMIGEAQNGFLPRGIAEGNWKIHSKRGEIYSDGARLFRSYVRGAQARQGLSSSGRRLSWALFLLQAAWLRFAYFHQSLLLVESA